MADEPARTGKIGRLPVAIRNEVNRRLHANEPGPVLLRWLNKQPAVLQVLDEYFHEQPVSAQNLSEWRQGGFQDWLKRQEQSERIKDLAGFALSLGEAAGGNISDGTAAILGGKIMLKMEALADEDIGDAVKQVALLRMGDHEAQKMGIRKKVLEQRDAMIDLNKKKFQRTTCELFLKWAEDDRAKKVIDGRGSNAEKIEQLGQVMFGEDW